MLYLQIIVDGYYLYTAYNLSSSENLFSNWVTILKCACIIENGNDGMPKKMFNIQKVNESGTQSSFLTNWENRKAQDFQHSCLLWKISQHPQWSNKQLYRYRTEGKTEADQECIISFKVRHQDLQRTLKSKRFQI